MICLFDLSDIWIVVSCFFLLIFRSGEWDYIANWLTRAFMSRNGCHG